MNIEELARQVRMREVIVADFRRGTGQSMTVPEQQEYGRIMRFAALVRNEALEEAAQAAYHASIPGTAGAATAAIRAMKSSPEGKKE